MAQTIRIIARNRNLTSIEPELLSKVGASTINLSNNLITEIPKEIGNFTSLSTLRLLGNKISSMPAEIANCKSLVCLDLGRNAFTAFPEVLYKLTWLHELDFTWNQIPAIPSSGIAALSSLRTLSLGTNKLKELPPEFGALHSLETLDLSINSFNHIPSCIQSLKSLTSLDVSGNEIFAIPEFIGGLSFLTKLDISRNKLSFVPDEIARLEKLTTLNLQGNNLLTLPVGLSVLASLKELNIAKNRIRIIPPCFFAMPNLKNLIACDNAIEYVDPSASAAAASSSSSSQTSQLVELDLSKNALCGVLPSFESLSSLLTVHLNDNSLTDYPLFPRSLTDVYIRNNRLSGRLSNAISITRDIRVLDLAANDITSVPASISQLGKDLRVLVLSFNRLSTLPGELNQLRAITTLDISFNEFKVIPQCVAQLRSLQVLNVASNAIEAIDDLGNIDALTYFNASGNKLKKFPAPLLKNLRLKTITLAANQIETIPADITKLITLESLDLSSNAVQDFSQVASCQSIMELNLANNQITKVPKGLQAMQCLQDLNLSRNKLIDFPYDCSVFQMGRLINLAHNEIKAEKGGSLPHFTRDRNTLRTTFIYNGNPELDKLISPQSPQQQQQQQQQQASLSMSSSAAQMSPFNVRVGWAEMRGKRPDMQDAFCVHTAFQNNSGQHLLGLYDGHSGSKSSLLLAKSIAQAFAAQLATGLPPEKALYAAYDAIEKEVEARKYSDGSTALTLFISGATLYTANTGDSKAVLASAGAAVDLNTFDRPDSEAEALRIRSLGGFVTQSGRVNGELALSKSIGDCVLRPYVTWEPTIKSRTLRRSDEFIIIGCDGLWDYVSSQEAVRIVRSTLHLADPFLSATTLRDAAYSHGSTDNISVVVAFLK